MANRTRRRSDPTLLFAIVTAMCAGFGVLAFTMQHENRARLAAYRADPRCRTTLTSADDSVAATGGGAAHRCSVVRTVVASRWTRYRSRTNEYDVATVAPTGGTDTFTLAVSRDRTTWNEAIPGTVAFVERFLDPAPGARARVTALRISAVPARTDWNPEYRAQGDAIGFFLFGVLTPLFAWLTHRSWKRRKRAADRVVVHETYRVTFKIP